MVYPRMRAWVAGTLFVLWLGFLAFLAFSNRGRIVVARPQIDRSNLVVIAALTDADGRPASQIKVQKILYAKEPAWQQLAGSTLELKELAFFSAKQGWDGPGDYVVPLGHAANGNQVTLMPLSPGYYPATFEIEVQVGKDSEQLAARLADIIETPRRRLRELFEAGPKVTLWHVPMQANAEFKQAVREAGGEIESQRFAEGRIYRATPDVLEQVDAIVH